MTHFQKLLLSFSTILIFSFSFYSQDQLPKSETGDFVLGKKEIFFSEYLQEQRVLNIYRTPDYEDKDSVLYDVLYVLDGSTYEDFPHIAGLVQFLDMYEIISPTLVVGIENIDRYRDFTFPSSDSLDLQSLPQSGGSQSFIDFIEFEVQPIINKKHQTSGHNTLIGQSLGGLLASEILLYHPHLFDDYILISPSLWWDQQSLSNKADSLLKANPNLEKRIVISLGTEHPEMHEVADELVAAIRNSGNKKLFLHYETLPKENHGTILHRGVYMALEVLNEKPEKTED